MTAISVLNEYKRAAATLAALELTNGMVVGLGSGSTAAFAIEAIADRVKGGLRIVGIPTSKAAAALARQCGVPLTDFSRHQSIDVTIDGADEVELGTLNLIKGLGGALLREKIVATASKRMIVVVDELKLVRRLGARAALPVEVVTFGWQTVVDRLAKCGLAPKLRYGAGTTEPIITDNGNFIVDCRVDPVSNVENLERMLGGVVGIVESGLFIGLSSKIIVGGSAGSVVLGRTQGAAL